MIYKLTTFIIASILISLVSSSNVSAMDSPNANETSLDDKSSPFSVGADVVSRYIFRGLDFGSSLAVQPSLAFSTGNFTIGAWGSYALIATETGIEADLYASYSFDYGITIGITDYYFPREKLLIKSDSVISPVRSGTYFDYQNTHFFELNFNKEMGNFYIAANVFISSNTSYDLYFETGYSFGIIDIFAGGGNEVYTKNGKFNIVNIGAKLSKELKLSDSYSLPVFCSIILNPDAEQLHLVAGITF